MHTACKYEPIVLTGIITYKLQIHEMTTKNREVKLFIGEVSNKLYELSLENKQNFNIYIGQSV